MKAPVEHGMRNVLACCTIGGVQLPHFASGLRHTRPSWPHYGFSSIYFTIFLWHSNSGVSSTRKITIYHFSKQCGRRHTLHLSLTSLIAYIQLSANSMVLIWRPVRSFCYFTSPSLRVGFASRRRRQPLLCKSISTEVINMAPADIFICRFELLNDFQLEMASPNCAYCVHANDFH